MSARHLLVLLACQVLGLLLVGAGGFLIWQA
jgi:hypothetical protein